MSSSTETNTANGVILPCIAAGVPQVLTLPIEPARPGDPKSGKSPARRDGLQGWTGLTGWQKGGVDYADLELADRTGGNCGLLLGCPVNDVAFAAIDIDLTAGQEHTRDLILSRLRTSLGERSFIIRETVSYRALVLVRVAGTEAGHKLIFPITHDGDFIGKIELLTTGQQCVIAGVHHSGNPIRWHASDRPGTKLPYPPLAAACTLDDFESAERLVTQTLDRLKAAAPGYDYSTRTSRLAGELVPDADLAPDHIGVSELVELVNLMPNPATADRDLYLAVMFGISATMHGISARRVLSVEQQQQIAYAACHWAAKWPKAGPDAFTVELAKWESDFGKRPSEGFHTSWHKLVGYAAELGFIDAPAYDARLEFSAEWNPTADKPQAEIIGTRSKHGRTFYTLADLDRLPAPQWLVDGLLEETGVAAFYGLPEAGKSFILLSLMLHIAAGRPWFGRELKQGAVIYIVGEGERGLTLRCAGMKHVYGIGDDIPFFVVPGRERLNSAEGIRSLIADIKEMTAGIPVRVVAFDTLAKMMAASGLDENSTRDMGLAVEAAEQVKEAFGCSVVLVHHEGKDSSKGMRGSLALRGGIETALHVVKDDTTRNVTVWPQRQKDGDPGKPLVFAMRKVDVRDGRIRWCLN